MKEMICIVCPKGCHLKVETEGDCAVFGNACEKGAEYGKKELLHPMRVLTATVKLLGGRHLRLSVKTNRPIPKERLFDVMKELHTAEVTAPIQTGDVVMRDILGLGADIVATQNAASALEDRDI